MLFSILVHCEMSSASRHKGVATIFAEQGNAMR